MSTLEAFEFLLVSTNYQTLTVVTQAAKHFGSNLGFAPTIELAHDYMDRRRVDGIFVDMDVPGGQDLIRAVREGAANRNTVVFVCLPSGAESPIVPVSGANIIMQRPLSEESVISHIVAARDIMTRERRRYFRHPVSVPVFLTTDKKEQRGMLTDVSEGGMAARLVSPIRCPSVVEFSFELSPGEEISGKGLVAWANNQGMIGVKFQFLRGNGTDVLHAWINQRQSVSPSNSPESGPGAKIK
jgi:hypothetical protein